MFVWGDPGGWRVEGAVRVITLRQPFASLVAAGVKTIETRSWRTAYRDRIAIHAAARPMGDGGFKVMLAAGVSPSAALTAYSTNPDYGIPLGAVVATAELVDCVPMYDDGRGADWPGSYLELVGDDSAFLWASSDSGGCRDVSDQLPFGVFEPGRWAWLLDDIKPVGERCPWCWGARFACPEHGRSAECRHGTAPTCHVCDGRGGCDPIPARGRQGLWKWKP